MSSLFKSHTTYDPIFALLNADRKEERDQLTESWRDHKLQELNFIGIVVCIWSTSHVKRNVDTKQCRALYSRVFSPRPGHGPAFYQTAQFNHGPSVRVGIVE